VQNRRLQQVSLRKEKERKEIKSKANKVEIKELRFTPNTDEHDIEFKAKHAEKFLEDGNKVKASLMFRGRSIVFKERGELLLLQFAKRLEDHAL
jgi:translation initiation factor IF-3